jgi:hypothetical protein
MVRCTGRRWYTPSNGGGGRGGGGIEEGAGKFDSLTASK